MQLLEERIRAEGRAVNEEILRVDGFLNHQVDVFLMRELGREFARLFKEDGITRVATIEASGIAPAAMTALEMGLPMVILKKSASRTLDQDILQTEVFSFTKNAPYQLTLRRGFIKPGDRVLLIDDFLANGAAALGAAELIARSDARLCGIGAVICKAFQPGLQKLRAQGYRVEALASIRRLAAGVIEFGQPD